MNFSKLIGALTCAAFLLAGSLTAAEKSSQTCCEKAAAAGKDCTHKCCLAAHKHSKSCEHCNPNKQDLNLKKAEKKSASVSK